MGRMKSNPSLMDGGVMDDTKLLATVDEDEDVGVMHDIDEEEEGGIDCGKHCCVLASSPVVYLTWITAFVGIGIGGTFESMIGFLSTSFVPPQDQVTVIRGVANEQAQNQAAFVGHVSVILFLAFQVLARITATVIVKLRKWQSYLFIMWMVAEVIGMAFIMFLPLVEWAFILGTACIGFGFGGTLSTLTAHVAVHFPGGMEAFPYNLGLALLAPGFGNLVLGVLEDVIDNSPCVAAASTGGYQGCLAESAHCAWFNSTLNGFIDDPSFSFPPGFLNDTASKKFCVERCKFNPLHLANYNGKAAANTFKFYKSCYVETYTLFYTVIVIAFITSILNVIFVQKDERRKKELGIVEEDVEVVGGH